VEGAILARCAINVHVRDINTDTLLVRVLGFKNVFYFHDFESAASFPRGHRRFRRIVLNRFASKLRGKLNMVVSHKGREGDYFVF